MIKLNVKPGEVPQMRFTHFCDQRFFGPFFLSGPDHDRRTMRVIRTDVKRPMASQFLKTNPDVRLEILDQMTKMNRAVGIREGGSDKKASDGHACSLRES